MGHLQSRTQRSLHLVFLLPGRFLLVRFLALQLLAVFVVALLGMAAPAVAGPHRTTTTSTAPTSSAPTTTTPASTENWSVYHHDTLGSGAVTTTQSLLPAHPVWTSPSLDGALYGEPLVVGGVVFVATENNTVYALNGLGGSVLWSTHLGTPVPSSQLPCGDISPTVGITGTPVIDQGRHELFAVADELVGGQPAHHLVGLNTSNGAVELDQQVDPSGQDTASLLQRTGLTVDRGQVIFGFGGNFGDCGTYHGWVASVPETGGAPGFFEVDSAPGESHGAVWMGGAAPLVDGSGNIWVGVGNGSVTDPSGAYDNSDSVLQLSPSLQLLQYFAPSSWASDNASDFDLGSSAPAFLPGGLVLQGGKSHTLYLLDGGHLGGIGGQLTQMSFCAGDLIGGGTAVSGDVAFVPCESGLGAVRAAGAPASLTQLWQTSTGGGPPIVVGSDVWTISRSGTLESLSPATGATQQTLTLGSEANHFTSPSFGDGLLLAPSATQVHAFAGPTPTPSSSTSAPTTTSTTAPKKHAAAPSKGSSGPPWVAVGIGSALGAGVLGYLGWLLVSRLRRT